MSEPESTDDSSPSLQIPHDALIVPYERLSDGEELANAITHGSGCAAAILVTGWVVATHSMTPAVLVGFLVYAASLAFVFLMSTVSHVVTESRRLHLARAWDQGAIYLLIAGTYTPGVVAFAAPGIRFWLLAAIWLLAGFGFLSKVVGKHQIHAIDTWTYIALGWLPAMILAPGVTLDYFLWMLAGGLAYSLGVCFLLNDSKVRYFHAVWHLLVMLAAGIHYYAIYLLAL